MLREVLVNQLSVFLDDNFNRNYKGKFLDNCKKISIYVEDICPHCGKGIDMARAHHSQDFLDIFKENQTSFNIISIYQCPCCHRGFVVMHNLIRHDMDYYYVYAETSQTVFPIATPNLNIDYEIQKISPRFYETYTQCLKAKSSGLNKLYGMGFRKSLEYLVKDFAIYENPDDKGKIESISLHECIEKYFKNSDAKTALLAAKWLGNNETHYVNNNNDEAIQLLENLIEDTLGYIHRELRNKKAMQINANKGKILGLF